MQIKRNIYYFLFIGFAAYMLSACDRLFIKPDVSSDPEKNFEIFWNDINNTYPFFAYDKINWDSIYTTNRPRVNPNTTDGALFNIFKDMMRPLLDGHISLRKANGELWVNERHYKYTTFFNFNTINNGYLGSKAIFFKWPNVDKNTKLDTILRYAYIENENILYFDVRTFDTRYTFQKKLDSLIRQNQSLKGLILDVRNNGGGFSATMQQFSSVFIKKDSPLTYGYNKRKLGPLENNFGPLFPLSVTHNPSDEYYNKPIVLLTNRFTFSAAEHFTLVMRSLPNTTIVGDTTGGAFSPIIERVLPNGIKYIVTSSVTYDANNVLYEKVGIPPQIRIVTTPQDSLMGKDRMMEKAIDLLK